MSDARLQAYAKIYADCFAARLAKMSTIDPNTARESARKCVEDFRDLIATFPECEGTPAVPSNIATNPDAGTF